MADSGSSVPASAHKTYGSKGYGGRAEVANGNAITQQQTDAGGLAVG
jgi:hypothetical protein